MLQTAWCIRRQPHRCRPCRLVCRRRPSWRIFLAGYALLVPLGAPPAAARRIALRQVVRRARQSFFVVASLMIGAAAIYACR